MDRNDGRTANQLRPLACSRSILHRAHGSASWSQVAICCCVAEGGSVVLDPTKLEEQQMRGFAYLVFPNSGQSALPETSSLVDGEPLEHGIITSVTHGIMSVDEYLKCVDRGRAACSKLSGFVRRNLQSQLPSDSIKAA
ncbi:Exosome complex exonuclease RRP46 homolog [Linum perenne]